MLTMPATSKAGHDDFPHMLFFGPSGAGKKTRIMCLLKELYGPGAQRVGTNSSDACSAYNFLTLMLASDQLKIDQRLFLNPSRRKIEVNIVSSNYHIELTPR
jgi:replication factor C subunit 3/5